MKLTGPEAYPPLESCSFEERRLGEVDARARAAAEDDALTADPVEDRLHRVLDREDEARGALRRLLEADVEPDRGVERRVLVDEDRLREASKVCASSSVREVAALAAPRADRAHDPARSSASRSTRGRVSPCGRGSTSGRRCSSPSATRTSGTRRPSARRPACPCLGSARRGAPTRPPRTGRARGS